MNNLNIEELKKLVKENSENGKRADHNQFAAPRRDGAVLELTQEQYHSMIAKIMLVTSPYYPSRFGDLHEVLKSYGIIGGAK